MLWAKCMMYRRSNIPNLSNRLKLHNNDFKKQFLTGSCGDFGHHGDGDVEFHVVTSGVFWSWSTSDRTKGGSEHIRAFLFTARVPFRRVFVGCIDVIRANL